MSDPPRGAWREPAPGDAPLRGAPRPPAPGDAVSHGAPQEPPGNAPRRLPRWLLPLGVLVALEPALLLLLWLVDRDLADGNLAGIAIAGGLLVSVPALAIFGLAVVWDRRMAAGGAVPGLPPALTGPRASRAAAVALAVSTLLVGVAIGFLLGPWGFVALPPLALSVASAWLMARAA